MNAAYARPLQGTRIMIAEDNAIIGFDLSCLLRNAGAEIIGLAKNLLEAEKLASSRIFEGAVLDVSLGDEKVFPVASILRERRIGVVFYTAEANPEELRRDWPNVRVLIKPSPDRLLIEAVAAISCGKWL